MTLQEFVALPHRFRWGGMGGDDCTTFCATWIQESIGIDPAASYRGTYASAAGANDILTRAGGLVAFAAKTLEPTGFKRIQHPQDGDVGVVQAPTGIGDGLVEVCAIKFGPLWLVLGPAGVVAKKLNHVAAWRFTG